MQHGRSDMAEKRFEEVIPLNPKALQLIEAALKPIIEYRKRDITKMVMYVPPNSQLLEQGYVQTKYGVIVVDVNNWLAKGTSYIIEEISIGSAFGWVRRKEGGTK